VAAQSATVPPTIDSLVDASTTSPAESIGFQDNLIIGNRGRDWSLEKHKLFLKKLQGAGQIVSIEDHAISSEIDYHWIPVNVNIAEEYQFPTQVSKFMREKYSGPAIYRWLPFKSQKGDVSLVYIGEADNFVRRVNGYLNPGSGQDTNIMMSNAFKYLQYSGHKVALEELKFTEFNLGSIKLSKEDLRSKLTRILLEHMFAVYLQKQGWVLMNADE
jgi:hypothetical protein